MEVPKLAFYFDWKITSDFDEFITIYCETQDGWVKNFRTEFTNPNQFEILGKLSELIYKDCEEFVENDGDSLGVWYKNYNDKIDNKPPYSLETPKESFISLLQSEGIDINKEHLILKIL